MIPLIRRVEPASVSVSYQKRAENPATECEQMNGGVEIAADFADRSNGGKSQPSATGRPGSLMKICDPRSLGPRIALGLNE